MIKDLLFPPRCPFCEKVIKQLGGVCNNCKKILPYIEEPRCIRCSKPIFNEEEEFCFDCTNKSFHYISGKAVWRYNKLVAESIARFKFKDKQEYSYFYAGEMIRLYGSWIMRTGAEALIPVPIHNEKRKYRGYNQADLLAKLLGMELKLPVLDKALLRAKKTLPQ